MAAKKVFSLPSVEEMEASTSSNSELDTLARFKAQRGSTGSFDQPSTSKVSSSHSNMASIYGGSSRTAKSDSSDAEPVTKSSSSIDVAGVLAEVGLSESNIGLPSPSNYGNASAYLKNPKLYEETLALMPQSSDSVPPAVDANVSPSKAATVIHGTKSCCMLVNPRQRGNPILKFVRNVPLEYSDIIPDYILGQTTCAIFLSLRYHLLNPDYIHERLKVLGQQFKLRILLVQVDVKDPHHVIKQMTKIAILTRCTLMLAWSPEEAGRYLEIYKVYENKPPELIMERQEGNPSSKVVRGTPAAPPYNRRPLRGFLKMYRVLASPLEAPPGGVSGGIRKHVYRVLASPLEAPPGGVSGGIRKYVYRVLASPPEAPPASVRESITDAITTIRSVSKTNAVTLMSTFKTLNNVIEASKEDLSFCPGIGPQKAECIHNVLHEQFLNSQK